MKATTHQCDESLATDLATDLDGCFETLVQAYQARLYGFAVRLMNNPRDAEEAAQDAFIRAYRALCGYPPERIRELALKPWLYRIALNVCRNRLRGRRLAQVSLESARAGDDEEGLDPPDDGERQPEAIFDRMEESARLADLVAALPERYRVPVVLRFVQELSYQEIAEVLGQPVGTAKANVHRGIGRLRAAMVELESQERDGRHTDDAEDR